MPNRYYSTHNCIHPFHLTLRLNQLRVSARPSNSFTQRFRRRLTNVWFDNFVISQTIKSHANNHLDVTLMLLICDNKYNGMIDNQIPPRSKLGHQSKCLPFVSFLTQSTKKKTIDVSIVLIIKLVQCYIFIHFVYSSRCTKADVVFTALTV